MKKKEGSFATGEFFNVELKGPALPLKFPFKKPKAVFPFAPHPRQAELDAQKAIPSLVK